MLELLLKRGADTTIKTHSGLTALDVAIEHKHTAAEAVVRNHLAQISL
jgi:ankyrin repeat protein